MLCFSPIEEPPAAEELPCVDELPEDEVPPAADDLLPCDIEGELLELDLSDELPAA
jgi:hypothetical protein